MTQIRFALCATLLLSTALISAGCSRTPDRVSTDIKVEFRSQQPTVEVDNLYSQMSGDLDSILLPEEI